MTEPTSVRLREVERERDLLRAELEETSASLVKLYEIVKSGCRMNWVVARDGGRDCVRCDQEIRRGEAYELTPGVDELQHVHCPPPSRSWAVPDSDLPGSCGRCLGPILRGQAAEPVLGAKGSFRHVCCPEKPVDSGVLAGEVGLRRQLAKVRALTCVGVDLYDRAGGDTVTVAEIRDALGEAVHRG